jgi:hypothetical protein
MKRLICALALGFLFTAYSFGQIGFGIKGGVNFATIGGADAGPGIKSRTGFAAGGYLEVSLPFLLTIQPEVLYTTKGSIFEQTISRFGQPVTITQTSTYSYLEIPVLAKYSLPVPVVKPSLYVGPEVGFLLSAKNKFEDPGSPTTDSDIKSFIASTDFGAVLGASAHILVADLDLRYTLGLKSISKAVSTTKVYNRVFSIMVQFPLF